MLLCKTCLTLLKFIPFWHRPTLTRGLPNSFWCHPESWCFPEHLLCVVYWFHSICFSPKTESSNRIRTTFVLFPSVLYVTSAAPVTKVLQESTGLLPLLPCVLCISRLVMPNSEYPWAVAHQAPLSMGFLRQEYWSGLPFPFSGDLPDPGVKPRSPTLQTDSLLSELPGKPFLSPTCT